MMHEYCLYPRRVVVRLVILALFLLPLSHAKGGGHGGGGHGHGRRRRNPPLYKRAHIALTDSYLVVAAQRVRSFLLFLNPLGYSDMPEVTENMSVLVDSVTETYEQGKVIKVHDDTGVFDVLLSNGTIMRLRGHANLVDWFFIALCLTLWRIAGRKKRREAKFDATFDDLLLKRQQSSKPPISGAFQGRTDESDGTTQDVEVKLEFSDDDLISGHGFDSRDGNYTIKGNYTGAGLLRWTEYYIDSNNCCASKNTKFTTTVRGTYSYKTESIDCFFRSSRGIVGDFTLRLKKVPNDAPLDGLHHRKKHG